MLDGGQDNQGRATRRLTGAAGPLERSGARQPALGQHTNEVLREMGHTDAEIQGLRDKRVTP